MSAVAIPYPPPDLEAQILQIVAEKGTIAAACRALGVLPQTMAGWLAASTAFESRVQRARLVGVDMLAESLIDIPDQYSDVQVARLKSDNIKWLAAKAVPSKYGDRLEVSVTETINLAETLQNARSRLICDLQNEPIDVTPTISAPYQANRIDTQSEGSAQGAETIDIFG